MLGLRNPLTRLKLAAAGALRPSPAPSGPPRLLRVIGHRGAARLAPENTTVSFEKAIDEGADGVEADVCVTRDGVWVLWHDARPRDKVALARQVGAEGYRYVPDVPALASPWRRPVHELTFEEFRAHHAYVPAEKGGGDPARVPVERLDDLLAFAEREGRLKAICLDLKLEPEQAPRAAELVERLESRPRGAVPISMLSIHGSVVRTLLESTRPREDLRVVADFELPGALQVARGIGASSIGIGLARRLFVGVREELVQIVRARDSGLLDSVTVWTVNQASRLMALVALRVDGIVTDEPALLRALLHADVRD